MANKDVTMPAARKPFYRHDPLTTILFTVGIFFASQVIAVLIVGTYPALKNWPEAETLNWLSESTVAQFGIMLIVALLVMGAIFYLLKRAHIRPARIGFIKPQWRDIGYAAMAYGLYFLTYMGVLLIASNAIPALNVDQEQQIGFEQIRNNSELLLAFISLVVLPPLWEETVFRGFLFSSLRAKFRLRYAIIITSIMFGIVHLQFGSGAPLLWVAAIDTFILSCFLCLLREKTGAIYASMLLHALKNSIAFYFLFLQ